MSTKTTTRQPEEGRQGKRLARTTIISFRLRQHEAEQLEANLRKTPVSGIESLKQLARMVTVDYAAGRVVYVNPVERKTAPDTRATANIGAPECWINDKFFLRSLRRFLQINGNWQRLRFFMLRAGWPEDLLQLHNATSDEDTDGRLRIALKFINRMLQS
jgi:hypothetical protein